MRWKIYFWMFALIVFTITALVTAISLGILFPEEGPSLLDESWNWFDWLSILVAWVGMIGLFGFAYKKKIGEQDFWKRTFIFILAFDISYAIYYPDGLNTEDLWFYILAYSLSIPYYVALYCYGYKFDSLWNSKPISPR